MDVNDQQRCSLIRGIAVFLASYVLLFLAMSRRPHIFDEGIVLTGAMRVQAGLTPHRDFYFIYAPAQIYILAGLFKLLGTSLLAERLLDLGIRALVVTLVYCLAQSYSRRSIAGFVSTITIMWLFGLSATSGSAVIPVSLLNLIGSWLILPVFAGRISTKRILAAGVISGTAVLFRYDTGMGLVAIQVCLILFALWSQFKTASDRLRNFSFIFWPYVLGFALLTIPVALYYSSVVPFTPFVHDIILYPAKYYHRGRGLPFPEINLRTLENLEIYLPIVIAGVSLYPLISFYVRAKGMDGFSSQGASEERAWHGFLATFGLLLVVMYLKGIVRVDLFEMYLAIIPSLLLVAVLFQHASTFPRPFRIIISSLMCLSALAAGWQTLHEIHSLYTSNLTVVQRIISVALRPSPQTEMSWCEIKNPLTKGFCFLPENDRIQTIKFILDHTSPGQRLYVGVTDHSKIFANDNLIYFATQRLPATRWSQLDPDLQSRYDVQTQMIDELQRNVPPYIVLDSEFDSLREPNDSAKSSGVTLLDDYIHLAYEPSDSFGALHIWRRRN